MRYWAYSEIKTKVEADLGLEEETFISDDEMLAYANEAIDEAEAEIHSTYEDYFLKRGAITFVSGTDAYALPSDIYANKLRGVFYRNGTNKYPILRERDNRKLVDYEDAINEGSLQLYKYFLINETAGTPQMLFVPTPLESGAYVKFWYYRNANRLVATTDVCDIPEFVSFVIQFMKVRCYEKEAHPSLGMAIQALEQQRAQMKETLSTMVPDANNEIEADFTHYEEHN